MKLKTFILSASCGVAVLFFALSYLFMRGEFEQSAKAQASQSSAALAGVTFAAMYELMSQGWTRHQVESFIQSTRDAAKGVAGVQIYRSPIVEARYGEIQQPVMDQVLQEAIASGLPIHVEDGKVQRHVYPLRAEAKCLSCHDNAQLGDSLGAIEVTHDLAPLLTESHRKLLTGLTLLSLVAMLGALLVVFWVNRRIERAIHTVEEGIASINQVDDLKHLHFQQGKAGFEELDHILASINQFGARVREIAVDKDILKFEISLLEKFVITSEVVKDWRQYLSQLLDEINKILVAHMLFSVFKIDEELFDLEIFWHHPPTQETRDMMERHVRQALADHSRFGDIATVNIHHHICKPSHPVSHLTERDVAVRVKSFFVETPKIGGIVGIGVHAQDVDDTRYLVMDSVLSTLLNVIGSVKAIYKYTRDLEYYATRDPLTDLFNQRVFWEMLGYEVGRSQRHDYKFGLLLIDLDNFKTINDNYGHRVGDRFLQSMAINIRQALRNEDILARYGGDEFVIILPETDLESAAQIANRMLATVTGMALPHEDGAPIKATVSIGLAIYPDHAQDSKDLFLFADTLMYKAKGEGKNRVAIPTDEDAAQTFRDISQRSMLVLNAIENKEILPFYQPILDIKAGKIIAYECLSRLPFEQDVLRADQFVELAEKMGVIHRMDLIVIEKALLAMKQHAFDGLIFFNLSPRALVLKEFAQTLQRVVQESGIAPERIVFEITERDTVRNLSLLDAFLADLKSGGFKLALDDFGSGFSSFHYLRRFPIDYLKLEGDFIANILNDERDKAFVQSMRDLAGQLGLKVIAEFVESQDVLDALDEMHIHYAQGYHVGRPAPSPLTETEWQRR